MSEASDRIRSHAIEHLDAAAARHLLREIAVHFEGDGSMTEDDFDGYVENAVTGSFDALSEDEKEDACSAIGEPFAQGGFTGPGPLVGEGGCHIPREAFADAAWDLFETIAKFRSR